MFEAVIIVLIQGIATPIETGVIFDALVDCANTVLTAAYDLSTKGEPVVGALCVPVERNK